MRAGDVLERTPGLTRSDLAWWENAGYLKPKKTQRGKVRRREYSKADLRLIQAMWGYRSEGYFPRRAYELAMRDLESSTSSNRIRAPPTKVPDKYTLERFLDAIFAGKKLSLEQICHRAAELVASEPDYQATLQQLLDLIPSVGRNESGQYSYHGPNSTTPRNST